MWMLATGDLQLNQMYRNQKWEMNWSKAKCWIIKYDVFNNILQGNLVEKMPNYSKIVSELNWNFTGSIKIHASKLNRSWFCYLATAFREKPSRGIFKIGNSRRRKEAKERRGRDLKHLSNSSHRWPQGRISFNTITSLSHTLHIIPSFFIIFHQFTYLVTEKTLRIKLSSKRPIEKITLEK